jgi:hypothetical protein
MSRGTRARNYMPEHAYLVPVPSIMDAVRVGRPDALLALAREKLHRRCRPLNALELAAIANAFDERRLAALGATPEPAHGQR